MSILKYIFNIIIIFILTSRGILYAADVLFIRKGSSYNTSESKLKLVCQYYGLNIETMIINRKKTITNVLSSIINKEIHAIVITEDVLPVIDLNELLNTQVKGRVRCIPILIIDVKPHTDSACLSIWSGGSILGCKSSTSFSLSGFYKIGDFKNITRQLCDKEIPFNIERLDYFMIANNGNTEKIITLKKNGSEAEFPVFVKSTINRQEVFFITDNSSYESHVKPKSLLENHLVEIIPLMMFLRYAFGERCWHTSGNYANLTIDDPWLTEPYGYLSYKHLLKQMEIANFHTTIAFIPWNYYRSDKEVAALFQENPERFSICVHGNNHDHYEFYKHETGVGDPWPAKPLDVQERNIRQAIARMERFKKLTGVSYDRVMVFPHGISPAKTLGVLKKYNFLATVNAENVPLGSKPPEEPLFHMRGVMLDYENFASLRRYPGKGRSQPDIAIDLFLGNPLLFYSHHDLFENGIDAFNETARLVNHLEPTVQWRSLGYISRHLYLQRKRADGNYDIRAFTRSIEIGNTMGRGLRYFIRKEESFQPPIRRVTVNGREHLFTRSGADLCIEVFITTGESKLIDIEYKNDLDIASIDISKDDPYINRLRQLSDFRDVTLSRNSLGRVIIKVYYDTGIYKLGIQRLAVITLLVLIVGGYGAYYLRKRRKLQRTLR